MKDDKTVGNGVRLDYLKTFIIGLGFFTVSIVWSVYNVAVPIYLKDLGLSGVMVGSVMTIDNLFAIIFLPLFGALSDKTNTRYGRRMPFLLIGIPLSAIAFFIVPFARHGLVTLMLSIIALNFFMSIYRAPTVALMPDFTPHQLRSKANGIINFMGGVGAVITFLAAGLLFKIQEFYPFAIGSLILVVTIIVMYLLVKEPENIHFEEEKKEEKSDGPKREKGELMSLILLLLAIFFLFTGYNAIETFFSTYGEAVLGMDKSETSLMLSVFSGFLVLFSIPSGIIASKIGRKRTIMIGLTILMAVFASMIFIKDVRLMFVLLAIGGLSWALVNINSYPMVVEMASKNGTGKYTGYYYFFSMLAAIVSPILFGFLKDILGDSFLFIYSSIAIVIAMFFIMLVKHGEAGKANKGAFESIEYME
jgi:MFS family permease